jgi:hypothetical protein
MRYFLTRIESDLVAIGSMPQTIENVKALLEANDVAIDRGLGVLHKSEASNSSNSRMMVSWRPSCRRNG